MTETTPTAEPAKVKTKKAAARAVATAPRPKGTKADAVVALLTRTKGATLDDMMAATGWQSHSVRGFISGTLKKKLGRTVTSENKSRGRTYRIVAGGDG